MPDERSQNFYLQNNKLASLTTRTKACRGIKSGRLSKTTTRVHKCLKNSLFCSLAFHLIIGVSIHKVYFIVKKFDKEGGNVVNQKGSKVIFVKTKHCRNTETREPIHAYMVS